MIALPGASSLAAGFSRFDRCAAGELLALRAAAGLTLLVLVAVLLSRGGRHRAGAWALVLIAGGALGWLACQGLAGRIVWEFRFLQGELGTMVWPPLVTPVLQRSLAGWLLLGGALLAAGALLVGRRRGALPGALCAALVVGGAWLSVIPLGTTPSREARWSRVWVEFCEFVPARPGEDSPAQGTAPTEDSFDFAAEIPPEDRVPAIDHALPGRAAGWGIVLAGAVAVLGLAEALRAGRGRPPLLRKPEDPVLLGACGLATVVAAVRVEWLALDLAISMEWGRNEFVALSSMEEDWMRAAWPAALVGWLAFLALVLGLLAWWRARRVEHGPGETRPIPGVPA